VAIPFVIAIGYGVLGSRSYKEVAKGAFVFSFVGPPSASWWPFCWATSLGCCSRLRPYLQVSRESWVDGSASRHAPADPKLRAQ